MADLREALESQGLTGVRTLLASGNVNFTAPNTKIATLTNTIEATLETAFGFAIPTVLRTLSDIHRLVELDPFKGIDVTRNTRLYISFSKDKLKPQSRVGFETDNPFQILEVTPGEIISVLTLGHNGTRTVDMMKVIETEYGKNLTTRNWNTVVKLTTA